MQFLDNAELCYQRGRRASRLNFRRAAAVYLNISAHALPRLLQVDVYVSASQAPRIKFEQAAQCFQILRYQRHREPAALLKYVRPSCQICNSQPRLRSARLGLAAPMGMKTHPDSHATVGKSESGCDFVEAVESWSPGLYPIGCAFRAYLSLCNTKCARLDETS